MTKRLRSNIQCGLWHKDSNDKPFKVVVFGEVGVGKSALILRYVSREFTPTLETTIEENYSTSIEVDGRQVKLEVIDTAGNEVFRQMRDQYIETGDGFLLVYSINDRGSSISLTAIREQILLAKGQKDKVIAEIPLVLVGNKCDLEDERKVSYQDGKKIAAGFSCPFFETSAKTDIGVDEVFTNLARQIKESKAPSKRKLFLREGGRFSLWDMSLRKRKSKEENSGREKRLRLVPSSEPLRRSRRSSTLRGFVCGGTTMGTS